MYPPPPPSHEYPPPGAGTPPVSSASVGGPAYTIAGGPGGKSNLDDAINVLRHHASTEFPGVPPMPGAPPGLPPMSSVAEPLPPGAPPHSTNGALLASAGAPPPSYLDDMGASAAIAGTSSDYMLPNQV